MPSLTPIIDFFAPNGLAGSIPVAIQERLRLHEIALAANDARPLEDILKMIYFALRDIGQFDRVGIWLESDESIHGSWGTDNHGEILDERGHSFRLTQISAELQTLFTADIPYLFYTPPPFPNVYEIAVPKQVLAIALRAEGETIGILFADNLLTQRLLTDQAVANVLLLCDQAASVIAQAHLREQRERDQKRRSKLVELSAAINASSELEAILRLVRDAIVDSEICDRAGVFTIDENFVYGSWGTTQDGELRDERHFKCPKAAWSDLLLPLASGRHKYLIQELPLDALATEEQLTYTCINVGLKTGSKLVGILCVDNIITRRRLHDADIEALLNVAEQAAAAIRNARLMEEMRRANERQERLANMATAIGAATALNDILHMVRDGVVSAGGFDRAGVFLYDAASQLVRGTWGTDRAGNVEGTSDESQYVASANTLIVEAIQQNTEFVLIERYSEKYNLSPDNPMYGVNSLALIPMRAGTEGVGVICVDNLLTDRLITPQQLETILPFAAQAAAAIQNARVAEKLRETQDTLIKVERLRAVGELASGVAHNINNVLAAILGFAELIAEMDETPPEIRQYARTIERAANDGAEIVRRLRQSTKKEASPERVVFNLAIAAQEALDLTRPLWKDRSKAQGTRIETVIDFAEPLPILGVPSEMREVLVNVIKNAAEAMPEGGTLTFSGRRQGETACVTVEDTGIGMPPEVLRHIFEPFFTTRGVEQGIGLGLSVAYGLVKQHQGQLEAQSELGKGSRFTLTLPFSQETLTSQSAPQKLSLEGISVLLVEDEEMIAHSIAQILERYQATAAFAYDAEDALQWLSRNAHNCHIIVSDHGMAGMTGLELLSRVRADYPHIRRVLLSGWGDNPPDATDLSAAEQILSKPIPADKLAATLNKLKPSLK